MDILSGQAIFVVWREALEAIFVIGILSAYLIRNARQGLSAMWAGVAVGIALSAMLAFVMVRADSWFDGPRLVIFESSTLALSAIFMTQMVFWMQKHGRALKKEIESNLQTAVNGKNLLAIAGISALAVAREGSEAVIYVYSLALSKTVSNLALGMSVAIGIVAAVALALAIVKGFRFLSAQIFLKLTSFYLLITAASLLGGAVEKLVSENMMSGWVEPFWDSSAVMNPSSLLMLVVRTLFGGYNPRPSLLTVLIYLGYWLFIFIAANYENLKVAWLSRTAVMSTEEAQ